MRIWAMGGVLAGAFLGCMQIGTDTGGGTSGGAGAATAATAAGGGDGGPSGKNCVQDSQGQLVLCEQIDTCPGVTVDQGAFPNCGFRLHASSALDLECVCDAVLCPIGVPTNCSAAQGLLDQQSSVTVCEQQDEGRCLPL